MNVTFVDFGPGLASARLRARIPQQELEKLGITKGNDVLIYSKDWLDWKDIKPFKKRIYDICDDHFRNPYKRSYYVDHAQLADVVTCNSEVMKQIIKEETGRDALIVSEPYESEEKEPQIGPRLLWYGHKSNLPDLYRIEGELKHPLLVLSNSEKHEKWTPETFRQAIDTPCIVIIPTGKSLAKSENRMVEAIRNGRYVCAEYLPSYAPFDQFYPLGDIPANIEQALANPESIDRIKAAQDYIRDRYSPEVIGKQWLEVINEYC